jgi:spermidine/putrescine transport system permease protein
MATPEIVLGASMLSLFLVLQINPGFWPTVIAHVIFCISFVVVTVKARIASLDPKLEQAAMDLYANERETFRRITLPLVAPGIAAAALLAFSLSFDDFIITNFNSGTMTTFPKFVYTSAARGIPAQANVIASAMFFLALAVVIIGQYLARKRKVS